jgi:hypothetical protein
MTENAANKALSLDPTRLFFNWKRYNDKGLGYDFTYTRSGKDFKPEMGFQQRKDYSFYAGSLQYGWIPGEGALLMNHKFELNAEMYSDNVSGDVQSTETELAYKFNFKSGYNGMVGLKNGFENVDEDFSLSDEADVPAGKYSFYYFETHLHSPQSNTLVMNLDGVAGGFYDGKRFTIGLEPEWSIGSSVQLSLAYEYNHVSFPDREQLFTANIARFKALVMFNTKLSVSTFVQYNSADNAVATNLKIRYNPKEGNDLYIVFNEGRNTYRDLEDPALPTVNNRSILFKYTYTFAL